LDKPHKKLDVWNISMDLVQAVYQVTGLFPDDEKFGLVSQLRRAAVSVPSNIAEGAARSGVKEFCHFLSIARGSLSEVDTQLDLAVRLAFISPDKRQDLDAMMERVDKMLYGLMRKNNGKT